MPPYPAVIVSLQLTSAPSAQIYLLRGSYRNSTNYFRPVSTNGFERTKRIKVAARDGDFDPARRFRQRKSSIYVLVLRYLGHFPIMRLESCERGMRNNVGAPRLTAGLKRTLRNQKTSPPFYRGEKNEWSRIEIVFSFFFFFFLSFFPPSFATIVHTLQPRILFIIIPSYFSTERMNRVYEIT